MQTNNKKREPECCPRFDPSPWEDQVFEWTNKKFIKGKVFTLFFIPVNFGQAMRKLDKKVSAVKGHVPDNMCLSLHTSKWNMDVYLAVDSVVPEAENITLSGKYYSKVYEGAFKETGNWCNDYEAKARSKGLVTKKMYMWYTTCPKCAKKFGENYVVIISEIE